MSSFGKKILSAFVEVKEERKVEQTKVDEPVAKPSFIDSRQQDTDANNKFNEYFNKLFAEANRPGPDYYEFSKMTEAMQGIPDEKARYCAVFAGLQVQGLDKQKLLQSLQEYQQLLDADAIAFHNTVNTALQEKVISKQEAIEEANHEMQQLSQQILNLQQQITTLTEEIAENEAKLENNKSGYTSTLQSFHAKLAADMEKIKQYIL
jgi:DNA repair exonuclease SbcCD ATPase subunit